MMNPAISCGVYFFDMLIIYIFFSRIGSRQKSTIKCLLIGLFLFEVGSGGNLLFQNNIWINTLLSFGIRIVFGLLCFRFRKITAVSFSAVLVVLNLAMEIVAVLMISALTGSHAMDYNNNYALLLIECAFSKLLFFITCYIISCTVVADAGSAKYQFTLLLYPLLSSVCLIISWYIATQPEVSVKLQYLLAFSSILLFASSILLFIIYQQQTEADREHILTKSENERLQTQKSYYDVLEQQNQKLMVYAHDVRKHLGTIQAINTNPDIEKYLAALLNQLTTYAKNCHSGNMMLDVMIDKFAMDCERTGLKFDYDVRSCNLSTVADIDLVAILGNLMDNALAAAACSEEKTVSLETTTRNGYDVVVISNSCDSAPNAQEGQLLTTKKDKNLHGFGLKSVSKTLKKYRGAYRWDYDDRSKMFTLTVIVAPQS